MWLSQIFAPFFSTNTESSIALSHFFIAMAVSLLIGLFLALTYTYKNKYTKSFVVTLAMIPPVVSVIIMLVNGNIGAGVAVAGAFSLVRFRSVPGTAKEIGAIFLAMGAGLAVGMGYFAYAVLFAFVLGIISILYNGTAMGEGKATERTMRITIPEDLDYNNIFQDLFSKYTSEHQLVHVKTASMGSLFKLTYQLTLNNEKKEKAFFDDLRCRNGNLEISMTRQHNTMSDL